MGFSIVVLLSKYLTKMSKHILYTASKQYSTPLFGFGTTWACRVGDKYKMPEVVVTSRFVNGSRRIESDWTVDQLASKLEAVTGIPPEFQGLQFTSESGRAVAALDRDAELSSLGLQNGWQIQVSDTRPSDQQLDLSGADAKYEIPLEDYEKRPNTVLQWKRENKLGRFADSSEPLVPEPEATATSSTENSISVAVGDECFVRMLSGKSVRGVVAFVGEVPHIASGTWIGVRLLSAEGKNNGTVKGVKLFDALPNHGILVKPEVVRPLDEDEEEL